MCFGCGQANPIGLRLRFQFDGERVTANFLVRDEHQGFSGLLHGGIMATLLDEAMGRLLYELGENAVTAELCVRLKRPVHPGETLTITGELKARSGRLLDLTAKALLPDGRDAAEATAKFLKLKA
jgi:uncharacterized protein (TIGR00369 family)